jgi:putative ubiquitin-RnfH superfamily antitoxin RatB of RatAB toxin-antitoxin module
MGAPCVPDAAAVTVDVYWSAAPRHTGSMTLHLPPGSQVADAVSASAAGWMHDGLGVDDWMVAVWGRRVPPDTVLRSGDRVELCRGLQVDPKEARRLRYVAQGGRAARLTRGRTPR